MAMILIESIVFRTLTAVMNQTRKVTDTGVLRAFSLIAARSVRMRYVF